MSILMQALNKLQHELTELKGGQKEKAVSKAVCDTLSSFCRQEPEFAEAVVQNDKTLSDCCKEIMKGVGSSISDIEVYIRAVKFYFPTASIDFEMRIDTCADVGGSTSNKIMHMNLDDLLDI